MKTLVLLLIAATSLVAVQSASASQLVYRPISPSLGGDPLNGNWLLAQQQAQDTQGSGDSGFSIDFPDFGGIQQPDPNLTPLPGNN